ncbi:hypothetical protein HF394_01190 [Planococcus glaciei]|uniref:Uncharacterized protein n=1 Tax=Planococcus glaciei TaxID=459472 RepID=A0A7H8Q5T2_9BACL|nr:hypothetical protein [Planococcus glaciei]QDY44639.1 hypothetical protein FK545_01225 [Planococcus glaciei]QKX49298.1 hypothetical protein HF394_01190 [Planococcus glaciei]
MRKLVEVEKGTITENQIQFSILANEPFEAVEAAGKMLADSDECAFVYVVDTGTEYIYVHFKQHTWSVLAEVLKRTEVPLLQWGEQIMPLSAFHEEMWLLIENIEGNDNYGEVFRTAVEEVFQEALASRS